MKTNKQNLLCLMMIFVIGAISAYDNTMTWIYRESIFELQQQYSLLFFSCHYLKQSTNALSL